MKRAKRGEPKVKTFTDKRYEISCPHCKALLIGGFGESTLRFLCHSCNNPIIMDWDFLNGKKNARREEGEIKP